MPGYLGMEFLAVEPDEVIARMRVEQHKCAWNGYLHAGAVVSLADTACGYATLRNLPDSASAQLEGTYASCVSQRRRRVCGGGGVHRDHGQVTVLWGWRRIRSIACLVALGLVVASLPACAGLERNIYEGARVHNESLKSTPLENPRLESLSYDEYEKERAGKSPSDPNVERGKSPQDAAGASICPHP